MDRVLLTGATGFIGQHILSVLEARGHQMTVVARPGWETRLRYTPGLTRVIETDDLFSEDGDWWVRHFETVDMVIHAAWIATPGAYLTSAVNLDCLSGTLTMAKAANQANVRRFVGLGTCIEYQSSDVPLTTDARLEPETPYAAAKVATFLALRAYFASVDLSFLWCRIFHPYGEGEHPDRLVPFLHRKLGAGEVVELTAGTQVRDFIDVVDTANLIVQGAFSGIEGPANICLGLGKSVRTLAEEIADIYGRRDLLRFGAKQERANDLPTIIGVPTFFL